MAIDDISNTEGECRDSEICTFEEDLCTWINGENGVVDNFDWLRYSGATPSFGTGPSVDHTYGTPDGIYLYIESSDINNNGDTAWLISEHFEPGQYCFVFWYHLYGTGMGTLNVYSRLGVAKPQLEWRYEENVFFQLLRCYVVFLNV